jgi:hypothetical protein
MPTLDSCIANNYEPGNIGASSGQTPVVRSVPSLVDPEDFNPDTASYSLDFTKHWNSFHAGVL